MRTGKYGVRCEQCGYLSPKWLGRCPECGGWNTFVEELKESSSFRPKFPSQRPQPISLIPPFLKERFPTGILEFDQVLGGGVVPGSAVLLGGEPGVGKSTLLLQSSQEFAGRGLVLLVSGEESPAQVRMRAERLKVLSENLYLLSETDVERIGQEIENLNPHLVIIDSIQTMFHPQIPSAPGSLSQVKESAAYLLHLAKARNLPLFFVGHVTKEGVIAGPRVLEHMVDTVLYFEGDSNQPYRLIRAVKNRYGPTGEIGVFEMKPSGLKGVQNPSAFFLRKRTPKSSGSVVVATMEGSRPLLVEFQALVTPSPLAVPRRLVTGLDYNRVLLTLAVLDRRVGFRLADKDVFVSVAGGIRVTEPAADMGIALSVASAYKNLEVPPNLAVFGEVGLGGEVRAVRNGEQRLKELAKLGFKRAILPFQHEKEKESFQLKLSEVNTVKEALQIFSKLME